MTTALSAARFDQPDLSGHLARLSPEDLDELEFGVIGIDPEGIVRVYNRAESRLAGLSADRVLGNALFTVVAPCMNNYLVAQRLDDALTAGEALDVTLDYVFTLRMRPTRVKLRLLASPGQLLRYVVVMRAA